MLVVTACILLSTRFTLDFKVPAAAVIFVVISGSGIVSLFVLGCIFPEATRVAQDTELLNRRRGTSIENHGASIELQSRTSLDEFDDTSSVATDRRQKNFDPII